MKKEDWDFKGENTKEYTHGFHTYPAMMIPQIARKLIKLYGKNAKTLLDPFCGSGTSLVEASLNPKIKEVYGFDLNPLAILIAKVKTTKLRPSKLKEALNFIFDNVGTAETFWTSNLNYWFKPEVVEKLEMLKAGINKIKDKKIRNFFRVIFSETIRKVSNTRNSEFKLYRMPEHKLKEFNPKVIEEFDKIALKSIRGMEDYVKKKQDTKIITKICNGVEKLPLKDGSVDIIVTSPPYGDSRTTVAYGQFSRLGLQGLGFEDVNGLDNELLGGIASKELNIKIKSHTLKKIIKKIAKKDNKRAKEVLSFYEDFDKCVINLNRVMAKRGFVCFVVGNRTVKGINIPTDKIMIEMFKEKGKYKHIKTYCRTIPNKRMPKVTSPTNIKGKTSPTISKESIFILQKKS
ncbi:hypothetical protein ES703_82298 [subsurface metagenome]